MSSGILGQVYKNCSYRSVGRKNVFEVWFDLFSYAKNLNGNWMYSQEVFNKHIAPTVLQNPKYFAECVEKMVEISGMKIQYKEPFFKALKSLKKLQNNKINRDKIIRSTVDILNSGLYEPCYAEKAMKLSGLPMAI